MEEIHQAIEVLGGETIELPGSLWYGIDSVDAATGDKPCEFPHPYRLDAVHADPEVFPEREFGMDCKDGIGEASEGGIDRHSGDESGSKENVNG